MAELKLELPDTLYERLQEIAAREGRSPAEFASEYLARLVGEPEISALPEEHEAAILPLEALFGSIESGVPDLSERHDEYLGLRFLTEGREHD